MDDAAAVWFIESLLVGRLVFPLTQSLLNRRGIPALGRELQRSESYPQEHLRALQLRRARELVTYAWTEIPFYARRFREAGLEPGDIRTLDDLRLLPILSRDDVIAHHQELVPRSCHGSALRADASSRRPGEPVPFARFRSHRLIRNTSSGSTGAPTTFYDDGAMVALSWAHELRVKRWFGVGPGEREARLARVSADYVATARSVRMRRRLWGQLVLPGMNLSAAEYRGILERIIEFRPRVLWGITTALTGLAAFVQRSGVALPFRPAVVVTWAAPLYDHERLLLEDVFRCPVTNVYGTREVGHVALGCPAGSLHVNQEWYYVESLPDERTATGEVLVTTLARSPMPFIRYRVGDVASLRDSACACGLEHQTLAELVGRTGDVFVTRDGRMLSPNFWCRMFMTDEPSRSVEQFQVVYEDERSARLRIVRRPSYSPAAEAALRAAIEHNLGASLAVELEYVSEIPPAPSGKVELVVRRVMETA